MSSPWRVLRAAVREATCAAKRIWAVPLRKRRRAAVLAGRGPRLLVVMNGGIGNAVEATPFVQTLRASFPSASLWLLVPDGDLFDDWAIVDAVVSSTEELRGQEFDRTFACVAAEIPSGTALGVVDRARCIGDRWFLRPEREYNLDLARPAWRGATPALYVSVRRPAIAPPDAARRISLVPGGRRTYRWRHKRWPYFAALLEELLGAYPEAQVCVLGESLDEEGWKPSHERVMDLRGHLTLRETAWVLQRSGLCIGNDCGPMHIAAAVRTPTIVLFGPTCEVKNAPPGAVVLTHEVPCRPCQYGELLLTCPEAACMNGLRVETVLGAAMRILGPAGAPS